MRLHRKEAEPETKPADTPLTGTVTFMEDEFENGKTGEKVKGITVIVDGPLKLTLDRLMQSGKYHSYQEIIRDALFSGLNQMIKKP